jgi:hypothetical protein
MFLAGCAARHTVLCIAPTGTFEPETGRELFEEINDQMPFTIGQQEFICKVKYDRIVGWALIPDDQKDAAKKQLETSETLHMLQVQALDDRMEEMFKSRWKASQAVRVK